MTDYLAWIDEQLAHHEREIAKLTIAREVMLAAGKALNGPSKPKSATKHQSPRGEVRDLVMNTMQVLGQQGVYKATAGMILNAIHPSVADEIKPRMVYNALYNAVKSGKLRKDGKEFSIQRHGAAASRAEKETGK